jgi:hypothetical protein
MSLNSKNFPVGCHRGPSVKRNPPLSFSNVALKARTPYYAAIGPPSERPGAGFARAILSAKLPAEVVN